MPLAPAATFSPLQTGIRVVGVSLTGGELNGISVGLLDLEQTVNGIQLAPFAFAQNVRGIQIGLVNYARSLQGLQIGLLNIVPDSASPCLPFLRASF